MLHVSRSRLGVIAGALALFGVVVAGSIPAGASFLSWTATDTPAAAFIPGFPPGSGPALFTDTTAVLHGVSCPNTRACVAVGTADDGSTLTELWDGTRWSVAPRSEVVSSALAAVSCSGPRFCFAVGSSTTGASTPVSTLTEMWDGTKWSVPTSPNRPGGDNRLEGVSCLNPSRCTAVGFSDDGSVRRTLVETWNGTAWSITPSPNVAGRSNELAAVSCGNGFCLAVGNAATPTTMSENGLVERFDGTTWSLGFAPVAVGLQGVACVHVNFCMVSGAGAGGAGIIGRWNGGSVTRLSTPAPGTGFTADFPAVTCVGSNFCVGAVHLVGPTPHSVHSSEVVWNGSSWSDAPGAIGAGGLLDAAACASTHFCFVVGGTGGLFAEGATAILGRS